MSDSENILKQILHYTTLLAKGEEFSMSEFNTADDKTLKLLQKNLSIIQSTLSIKNSDMAKKAIDISEPLSKNSMVKELNFSNEPIEYPAFSKVFFNSIINSLNDAIWSASIDMKDVFFVNPAFEELTGYTKEELIADSSLIRKMIHPEDIYVYQSSMMYFKLNGHSNCQYRIITKSNTIKWVQVKELLIKDENDVPIRIDGVKSDITESKKAIEKELNRANELLLQQEVLFRLSCLGIEISFDQKLKRIVRDAAKVTGTERASVWIFDKSNSMLVSKSIYSLKSNEYLPRIIITDKDYPEYFKTLRSISHLKSIVVEDVTKGHFTSEILNDFLIPLGITSMLIIPITKDNELFGIISLSHIGEKRTWSQDEQGFITSIANIVSIYFESEERRIIESALIEKTRVLLEAQHVARIGNYIIDLVTGTWKSSSVFDQIFGIDRSYVKDVKNWIKLISPEHSLNVFNVFKEVVKEKTLNNKRRFDESFKIIRQNDGEERWVTVLGEFQYDEMGNPTHMLGTMQDITERKKIEDDLIKAKEIAEELLTIKGNFLSNMSHEIRTPLNAILGFTRLLKESHLDDEQFEMMEAIDFSGKNLLVIVNDILDFSKIEANKMNFEEIEFSLSHTLKNTLNLMLIKADEKKLELAYSIDTEIEDNLIGDPTRLNQILINLVGNAIKFTDYGSVSVDAKLVSNDEDTVTIEFRIVDTGIGVAKDKMETIFESFNQASNDTTRKFGGSGLGLTITKKLIELQGGSIDVKSVVGEGSEFSFILSYKKQNEDDRLVGDDDGWEEITPYFLRNQKILMAEDILINQLLAKKIFNKWKCDIDIAFNGKFAIEKLKKKDYDLVLMDIQMPEMDGHEATKYIRENLGERANIPIIALSAHASTLEQEKCIRSGMNGLVSKPIDEDVLLREMYKWHNRNKPVDINNIELESLQENVSEFSDHIKTIDGGIIDYHYLNSITKADPSFIYELIDIVLVEMPKLLAVILEHNADRNSVLLRKEIHKLKASITIFGLVKGQELIFEMENILDETNSVEGIQDSLKELDEICSVLLTELGKIKRVK